MIRKYDDELKRQQNGVVEASNPAAAFGPKTVENDVQAGAVEKKTAGGQAQYVNVLTGQPSSVQPGNPAAAAPLALDISENGGQQNGTGVQPVKTWNENADFGVRNYLEQELGIDGKRIGFDGENVTFDGNPLIKAERVSDEGRSYVGDKSAVDAAVSQYAQEHGLVAARDYANSLGVPMNIQWDETQGSVVINGVPMKPDFISNGKAYVYQEKLDAVLKKADNGFKTYKDHKKDAYDKYGAGMEEAYNDYMNYGDFSYDQKDDRAYQDFMDVYRRAVEDEYANNMAQARFRSGGVFSPGAMQSAAAIRDRALLDAAMYGQQYEDRAYEKWKDSRDFTADKIQTAWDMMKGTYDLESGAEKADREAFDNQINNDWTRRFFENELAGSNSDLVSKLITNALHDTYAPGLAENAWKRDEAATNTAERTDRLGDEFDRNLMVEGYSQAVNTTEGLELDNLMRKNNLSWQDLLNLLDAASVLHSMKTNAAASGVSADGYGPLLNLVSWF